MWATQDDLASNDEHGFTSILLQSGLTVRGATDESEYRPVHVLPATKEAYDAMVEQGAKALFVHDGNSIRTWYGAPSLERMERGTAYILGKVRDKYINQARAFLSSLNINPPKK